MMKNKFEYKKSQVSNEISLGKNDLKLEEEGIFIRPKIPEFEVIDPPGSPALPVKTHLMILPHGSKDFSITISESEGFRYYSKKIPYPIQEDIPDIGIDPKFVDGHLSSRLNVHFTFPKSKLYFYQDKLVQIESIREEKFFTVVELSIRPLKYDINSKCFIFYPKIKYSLDYSCVSKSEKVKNRNNSIYKTSNLLFNFIKNYSILDNVTFADGISFPEIQRDAEYPHIIITDNYQWPESIDRGDGTTRAPNITERGIALGTDVISEFEKLAKWKTSCGLRSRVFTISDIISENYGDFTESNFARDLQEVIRNFLKHAQREWSTFFVLIGGDTHIVPMRKLVGSRLFESIGCRQTSDNPPSRKRCHFISDTSVVKIRPMFNPLSTHPLSSYHGGVLIKFNIDADSNNLGWYFTNQIDFETVNENFTRLPVGAKSNYIIVEGPNNIINDDYYWVRDVNLIPSDLYYSSLVSRGYSISGVHDFDINNNNLYGQYHIDPMTSKNVSLDAVDFWCDLWIGRASIDNQDQARAFVEKVICYEKLKTLAGINIDTSYLQKVIYAASYWNVKYQTRQNNTGIPPYEGRFTHINGTAITKIVTDFDMILYRFPPFIDFDFTNYRLIAKKNNNRIIIPYKKNASETNLGWYFTRPFGELFSDFTVNSDYHGQQFKPRIAMDQNGNFVVTWEDDKNENGVFQIYARGFNTNGSQKFGDITVNSVAQGQQYKPDIAMAPNGDFVVVWQDDKDKNGFYQILARGFNANGSQKFVDITINSIAQGQQLKPRIAMDQNGNFVVVWEDDKDKNGFYQILARGFNANGTQKFAQFTVNSVSRGQQFKPAIGMAPNGDFVVAWEDDKNENGFYQILARGFNANGSQKFADITVNSNFRGQQYKPAIAMASDGDFVVVWQDDNNENGIFQILGRGFKANGTQKFADITINSNWRGQQLRPDIAMMPNGDFVVVWQDDNNENGYYQILARGFNSNGVQKFGDITINSNSRGQQLKPTIAVDNIGNFVVTWEDDNNENGYYQILARGILVSGSDYQHFLQSNSATRFIKVFGPENDINPTHFLWDPLGLEQSIKEKEDLRQLLNYWYPNYQSIQRHYDDFFDLNPPPTLIPLSPNSIRNALNNGTHLVSLSGHGSPSGCCSINIIADRDFSNDGQFFIMFADSCSTARPDSVDSLAEISTTDPDGGSVAFIGNTRYSWIGIGATFERMFWNLLSRFDFIGQAAGARYMCGLNDFWTLYAQNLFGEPSMRVWSDVPSIYEVDHPNTIDWGTNLKITVRKLGNPVENHIVTILGGWTNSSTSPIIYKTIKTDSYGIVNFELPSSIPKPAHLILTISYPNFKPYEFSISVT